MWVLGAMAEVDPLDKVFHRVGCVGGEGSWLMQGGVSRALKRGVFLLRLPGLKSGPISGVRVRAYRSE
jgi:hypothetical protein